MNASPKNFSILLGPALVLGLCASSVTLADTTTLSKSDLAFVAEFSQGGMFEVAASKVAEN